MRLFLAIELSDAVKTSFALLWIPCGRTPAAGTLPEGKTCT